MTLNRSFIAAACCSFFLLSACGGGGDSQSGGQGEPTVPQEPSGPSVPLQFEILSGVTTVDYSECVSVNGSAAAARYTRLLRAAFYDDGLYLTESGEGCANTVMSTIRRLSDGVVNTPLFLNINRRFTAFDPFMMQYPSGYARFPSDPQVHYVVGYAAADSDQSFALDLLELERLNQFSPWRQYGIGLFQPKNGFLVSDFVVGTLGQGPVALVDGQGPNAAFVVPHDPEMGADGLLYVIDDGRIRTIDAAGQVRTLDSAALGINGAVKAMDADRDGNIHVLTQDQGSRYTWHRLTQGSKQSFSLQSFVPTELLTVETFTIVGDQLVLSVRQAKDNSSSKLYQVAANGDVHALTGDQEPTSAEDWLGQPSQFSLPAVQHIEYGPDGHLYMVLPQGVVVARDF